MSAPQPSRRPTPSAERPLAGVPAPTQLSWAAAAAIVRGAFRPMPPVLVLDLARGEGRTHLAPRWPLCDADRGLCGARLDASGPHAGRLTCEACAARLPPEAD